MTPRTQYSVSPRKLVSQGGEASSLSLGGGVAGGGCATRDVTRGEVLAGFDVTHGTNTVSGVLFNYIYII